MSNEEKRAIILCGGRGTRLRPYTLVLPKPLMPIGDNTVLEIIVKQLVKNKFGRITITVNQNSELIKAYIGDGSKFGVKIDYSQENTPLGTMGPLTLIKDLPENFLVMNGDILTELDFGKFYDKHVQDKNLFTISSTTREQKSEYGVLEHDENNILTNFKEKPIKKYDVSMGIYMLNREVLNYIPKNQTYGFDNLMLDLLKKQKRVKLEKYDGYWLDIGRPDDYQRAMEEFADKEAQLI